MIIMPKQTDDSFLHHESYGNRTPWLSTFDMRDIRTLCYRCQQDYISAGYSVIRTKNRFKEPCDICGKYGHEIILRRENCYGKADRPRTKENHRR